MKRFFRFALFLIVAISIAAGPTALAAEQKPQSLAQIEKNSDAWEFIIKPEYDEIERLGSEYFAVKKGDYWAVLNMDGRVIIEPNRFNKVEFLPEGVFMVTKGELSGFMDKDGNVILPVKYKAYAYSDGMAMVKDSDGTYSYIDMTGQKVIGPFNRYIGKFSDGLAWASVSKDQSGYINKKGEFVIAPKFTSTYTFKDGIAAVRVGEKYGLINTKGEFIVEPKLTAIGPLDGHFSDGYISVRGEDRKGPYYFINMKGEKAVGGITSHERTSFSNGLAVISQMKNIQTENASKKYLLYGVIDTTGNIIVPVKYLKIRDFNSEGYAQTEGLPEFYEGKNMKGRPEVKFNTNNKNWYLSRSGKLYKDRGEAAADGSIAKAAPLWKRLRVIKGSKTDKHKWGAKGYSDVIGGTVVIQPQFDTAGQFQDGVAKVKVGNKRGMISLKGDKKQPQEAVAKKANKNKAAIPDGVNNNYYENGTTQPAVINTSGENLLKNPGFEKAKGQVPDGWGKYWTPRIDSGESHSGGRGLKVSNNPAKTSPYNNVDGILQDFRPPLPKDDYTMSCWLRSSSGPLTVRMGMSDGSFGVPGSSKNVTINEKWKKYEYSDNASPGRAHICLVGEPGTFYIDDCVLVKNSPMSTHVDDGGEERPAASFEADFEIRLVTRDTPISEGALPSGIAVFAAEDISDVALDHAADGKPSIIVVLNEAAKKRLSGIAAVSAGDTLVIVTGGRVLAEYKIADEVPRGVFRIDNNYTDAQALELKYALRTAIFGTTSEN